MLKDLRAKTTNWNFCFRSTQIISILGNDMNATFDSVDVDDFVSGGALNSIHSWAGINWSHRREPLDVYITQCHIIEIFFEFEKENHPCNLSIRYSIQLSGSSFSGKTLNQHAISSPSCLWACVREIWRLKLPVATYFPHCRQATFSSLPCFLMAFGVLNGINQ